MEKESSVNVTILIMKLTIEIGLLHVRTAER